MEARALAGGANSRARWRRSRLWRVPATGFAFALFGVVGGIMSLTGFALIALMPIARARRSAYARRFIGGLFRAYLRLLNSLGLLGYRIVDAQRLHTPGALIIANHPSLLDVVFLMALTPANCVVKASLWRNPFTAVAVRLANYIPNNDPLLYQRCLAALAAGEGLIIFPEGTRSTPGQPLKFSRGPAYVAMGSTAPIIPVIIRCEPATLVKQQAWYKVPRVPPMFEIQVQAPLTLAPAPQQLLPSQAARRLTKFWQTHFSCALDH